MSFEMRSNTSTSALTRETALVPANSCRTAAGKFAKRPTRSKHACANECALSLVKPNLQPVEKIETKPREQMREERTPCDSPRTPPSDRKPTRGRPLDPSAARLRSGIPTAPDEETDLTSECQRHWGVELFVCAAATPGDRYHVTSQCLLDKTWYEGRKSRNVGKRNRTAKAL
ncbi:uncharacterized protein CC84DRAFT_478326 [Paraphaeosphaeria sporulosa]|uniref:Uncharacterized protein n=1 Tax=Paraphaeosphaeria sporulosa TaxID=1460663 RepID=A0A177CRZ4_9PLEO|nr:uncharacterized protein CC84DRAFT_478326 [Paraphaeosphaeria sporulosa]OAG10304.1 hypothetical protein CC84DRAFT_478326 [Paraphaeosphaeria sporulosa]